MSGQQEVELIGPDDGGWHTTRMRDWIAICPALSDTAYRLYAITRSLIIEKRGPVRKLTLLELCELLPGLNGKPSSLTRIRDAVRQLSDVGLFSTPEGEPVRTSSRPKAASAPLRIRINDLPAAGYSGWQNSFAKLEHIREAAAWEQESEAGRNSDPEGGVGRNSDPAGRKNDPLGRKNDPDAPSTSENVAPKEDLEGRLSKKTSGADAVGQTSVVGREGGGGCAASGNDQLEKVSAADISRTVAALPAAVSSRFGQTTPQDVIDAIKSELARGITADSLIARIERRWHRLYAADAAPGGRGIDNPKGVAEVLVDRGRCLDARCDDGTSMDTGETCRACERATEDRQAEHRAAAMSGPPATVPEQETYTPPAYVPEQVPEATGVGLEAFTAARNAKRTRDVHARYVAH